jgi:hypothetical protein
MLNRLLSDWLVQDDRANDDRANDDRANGISRCPAAARISVKWSRGVVSRSIDVLAVVLFLFHYDLVVVVTGVEQSS